MICPGCHSGGTIDLRRWGDTAECVCRHCGHRWQIACRGYSIISPWRRRRIERRADADDGRR
jgi:hypothetical protein